LKKKLIVFSDTYLKSSETFIYTQVKALESLFDITFIAQNHVNLKKFPFKKTVEIKPNFRQKFTRIFNPLKLHSSYAAEIEQVFRKINPEVIHVHFGTNAVRIVPIVKKLGIPMLITFHGSDASKRLRDARYRSLLKRELGHFDFVCVSKALVKNLEEIGIELKEDHVFYNGVDVEKFPFVSRESVKTKLKLNKKIRFIQISRFVEKKGHRYTLDAFKKLLSSVDKPHLFKLQLIGSGPLEKEMKHYVKSSSMEENVDFMGTKDHKQIVELLRNADALLQHSITSRSGDKEGLPIVIMEAMSVGLPVISTYHSGIPELISDEVNGLLVNEKDVEAYYNKMMSLITMKKNLGVEGRKTIEERFKLEIQVRKLAERINRLSVGQNQIVNCLVFGYLTSLTLHFFNYL